MTLTLGEIAAEGAEVRSRAELYLDGSFSGEFEVVDGSVTFDAGSRVLRSCDVTLLGDPPSTPSDDLAPIGSVVRLFRGAVDPETGELREVPLGRYAFDEARVSRSNRGTVSISGHDYSELVSEARWETPYEIVQGTNLATAVSDAVQSRLPGHLWQDPNMVSTTATVPQTVWGEERRNDPWDDIEGLARSDGKRLFFDAEGRLTLIDVPDPDTAPIAERFRAGVDALLLDSEKDLTGRPYNVVVVLGETEGDEDPVTATAEDDNPNSASYVGRYRKPFFRTSSYISTEGQAQSAATAELRRRLGLAEQAQISIVPLPGLDAWDVIEVVDAVTGLDARYVVDRVRLPLRPGSASLSTRRRRI